MQHIRDNVFQTQGGTRVMLSSTGCFEGLVAHDMNGNYITAIETEEDFYHEGYIPVGLPGVYSANDTDLEVIEAAVDAISYTAWLKDNTQRLEALKKDIRQRMDEKGMAETAPLFV